ncbi:MAG TPA: pallilysin-related adhesin [Spirochaetales bacterium]|nr:pallilysin-related adhesin [Spirochaetales bacterium]
MKKTILLIITILIAAGGCRAPDQESRINDDPKKVIPDVKQDPSQEQGIYMTENGSIIAIQAKIPLDPDEQLIEAININLDLDSHDEQILIIKKKGEATEPIKIAVVDFDTIRSRYLRSWESLTNATNIRTFNITLKDVVGDHSLEIICRGINSMGRLSLDVFRKTPSPSGMGLYFAPICQIVADGSIEIEEIERSEGYQLGQKNGPSFPIFAYVKDIESENILDLVKYSYYWQYKKNKYILTSKEKIPGEAVEEKQLAELFESNSVESFEEYLAGPWYLSGRENGQGEELILFNLAERSISIFSGDVQEIYIWKDSLRYLTNRLLIYTENESINTLKKRIDVQAKTINTIEIIIRGSELWDSFRGSYVKLSEEMQQSLLDKRLSAAAKGDIRLSGLYRSPAGVELIFAPPRFTWLEKESEYSGGFTVFNIGENILYLKGLNPKGLTTGDKIFVFDYSEKREDNRLIKTLLLVPAVLTVHGVEKISDLHTLFEQIEFLEDQN